MNNELLTGLLLDEQCQLSLNDLSRACSSSAEWVIELVEQGAIEPIGQQQAQWRFHSSSLQRARTAMRLQRDLGVNLAGVALALDLLDEISTLRAHLQKTSRFDE
ncbi:MAG: MerR family transcriptional regulator [Proteobacteria bacterium]|nr:MerR family transcriptional regulator [Pseudomonadota bacterium]